MGTTAMKLAVAAMLIVASPHVVRAQETAPVSQPGKLERVIAVAVGYEVHLNRFEKRKDVCVGFGHGLRVDGQAVFSELNARGLKLRSNEWCNRGLRGLTISVISPLTETAPNTYEFVLEVGDLSPIHEGAHFAALVRRGAYKVECREGLGPDLISYSKTCCPEPAKQKR
jgi:hypothetical protein